MRSVLAAVIGAFALVAICAGAARATGGGGGTIGTAPIAPVGAPQVGNTASFTDTCGNGYEFWTLPLKKGDLVKITWGAPAAVDTLALWPPGTVDSFHKACLYRSDLYQSGGFDWATSPVLSESNGTPTTTYVSQVVVPRSGSYPLLFLDTTGAAYAGAYSFTTVVLHAASVSLPHGSTIPGAGTLRTSVLAPDGSPINDSTVRLTLHGFWSTVAGAPRLGHRLATTRPVDGRATFSYSLPPGEWGKKIRVYVSGGGSSYQTVMSRKESVKVRVPLGAPVVLSSAQLKAASQLLRQPIYWAGPIKGREYEFRRAGNGYLYVRYLPRGAKAGAAGSNLVVATYPFVGAYAALKRSAKGKAVAGPNGSIFFVRPGDSRSVLVAFPNVDAQIEVYDPSPVVARAIVATGEVKPVR